MSHLPDLNGHNVVVILFKMEGCPACEEYEPRFRQIASSYQGCFPILIVDAADPSITPMADRLKVHAIPATFVLRRPTGVIRAEGNIENDELTWMLNAAAREAARGY